MSQGCMVASISMMLSSLNISAKPKDICGINAKYDTDPSNCHRDKIASWYGCTQEAKSDYSYNTLEKYLDRYLSNPSKYSPPMIEVVGYSGPWHYIVVTGKNSNGEYKVLNPADSSDTVLSRTYTGWVCQFIK